MSETREFQPVEPSMGTPSVTSAVRGLLSVPKGATRSSSGVWQSDGELPLVMRDDRALGLLEQARLYDEATEKLAEWTSAELVSRIEQNRYSMATFSDAARLLAAVLKLEQQVKRAVEVQAEAKQALRGLHDKRSPEALAVEKRLNTQVNLIREQHDKQAKKFERFRTQCQSAVAARQLEARRAEEKARDKSTIADVEATLKALRDISNEASGIVRSSRLADIDPGERDSR